MKLTDSKSVAHSIPIAAESRVRDILSAGGKITWEEFEDVPLWIIKDFPTILDGLHKDHVARVSAMYHSLSPEDQLMQVCGVLPTDEVMTQTGYREHIAGRNDSSDPPNWEHTFPYPPNLVHTVMPSRTQYSMYTGAFPRGMPVAAERDFLTYRPDPKMHHIHLGSDRNYLSIGNAVRSAKHEHILLTGATGSGKSTFGFINAISVMHTLLLLPTKVNVASALYEFQVRMPQLIAKFNILNPMTGAQLVVPSSAYQDINSQTIGAAQITLSTYSEFNDYVLSYGDFPPHPIIAMDEYHLTSGGAAPLTRQLLMNVGRKEPLRYLQRRLFMSATPIGIPQPAPVPTNLREFALSAPLPDIIGDPVPSLYTPKLYRATSKPNPLMLVLADSDESAEILESNLQSEGYKVTCLSAQTSVDKALVAFDSDFSEQVFITTPETSIGTTLRINVLVNPGTVAFPTFDQGLLYIDRKPQGPAANIQARGRGGRTLQTSYYYYPSTAADAPEVVSLPVLADTVVTLTALCNEFEPDRELQPAYQAYPKLKYLTALQAMTALHSYCSSTVDRSSPFLATYDCDPMGRIFTERGGSTSGFAEQNAESFRLYIWPSGQAYSAFLNLMGPHDITKTSTPAIASVISKVMESKAKTTYKTLDSALELIGRSPHRYLADIAKALAPFHDPSKPDLTEINATANQTFLYMFGKVVSDLFALIGPRFIKLEIKRAADNRHVRREIVFNIDAVTKQRIIYACPTAYRSKAHSSLFKGAVMGTKVEALILKALQPTIAATAVKDDPKLCTNLSHYTHLQETSGNPWFKELKL